MTPTPDPWQAQLDNVRESVLAASTICKGFYHNPQLADVLKDLSIQRTNVVVPPLETLGPGEALELLSNAESSLNLLVAGGRLPSENVVSPASQLRSAITIMEAAAGKELRKQASAKVYGLYVIIDPEVTGGRDSLEVAHSALRGGARMLQVRDKLREKGETLVLARQLKELCLQYGALLIVNDHADLAVLVDADGLHVGQGDLPVAEARCILGPGQILGRSNHLVEEAVESQAQGADHVALGATYPTNTKVSIRRRAPTGPQRLTEAKELLDVPLVAIGGINADNLEPVVRAGADAICVTSAVGLAQDPEDAARRLVEGICAAGGKA